MDFVFMLTRSDQTVTDCLDVLDDIGPLGLTHIGFKDVGVSPDVLAKLVLRIKAAGATSYMEVVSTSREACLRSAQVARDIGIDRLLGGTQVEEVLNILAGS
ncbi:MAG: 4-hydroxythreonine-4-phosphate dehydrogenase, partial [Rhodomicrobium sp.]